jgi:anaerobic magnesium-protoporphyrin IX monomethyl ester cyclase
MITLINPNLAVQRDDIFTTGIIYMPVSLAYFAGSLRSSGFECTVVDAFGENPDQYWIEGNFMFRGLTPSEVINRIPPLSSTIVLYANNITNHASLIRIIRRVRPIFPEIPIVVMENTQAVTAYSLRRAQESFYDAGADFIISGEAEDRGIDLLKMLHGKGVKNDICIDGVGYRKSGTTNYVPPQRSVAHLDDLAFPAWDLFPLDKYWRLKYAHGPFETDKYLPLLTSRGCPYTCKFCVIPETNGGKWRGRSAQNVVDEMETYLRDYGVCEFHIEDVNPTVSDRRIREICAEIIGRNLRILWKIAAGTKVETIKDETTLELMAEAGCRYISISPESGSTRILNLIGKSFDLDHALRMVRKMNSIGIHSQACFVLGYPGENDDDRRMTWDLVHDLTKAGICEIALFIVAPVPGAAIFEDFSGPSNYSQLNFSPSWRKDYKKINGFRLSLYLHFLIWKVRYHPVKFLRQPVNFLRRRFKTKMEMVPYRAIKTYLLTRKNVCIETHPES